MFRSLMGMLVLLTGMAASAAAGVRISPNNPYRAFNIGGVNYGSMQWERRHPGNYARTRAGGAYYPFTQPDYGGTRYRSGYRGIFGRR